MRLQRFYKAIIPLALRERVAGLPRVQKWRNQQLVRKGKRLTADIRALSPADGKIHVALLETRRGFWLNHASIHEAMRNDADFEVHVFAVPKRSPGGDFDWDEYKRLIDFFESEGIGCHHAYDLESRKWNNPIRFCLPDVLFLSQPYDFQHNFMYGSAYWKHFCDIAYLSYGLTINAFPFIFHSPCYDNCRFLFVDSDAHRDIFANLSPEYSEKLVVTGHPSLDSYLLPLATRNHLPYKSPQSKRRIVWAPHFTVAPDKTEHQFSNFFSYYETFIRIAGDHPELEIVLRPHPALFTFMVNSGMKTSHEAQEYKARFERLPNGRVYDDADYISLFRQSDAIILDSISFVGAYAPTGNPVCFLESPFRTRLNSIGERLLHADYAAWNAEEIREFVERVVLGGDDYKRTEREAAVKKMIFIPPEGAGMRIAQELKARLGKGRGKG